AAARLGLAVGEAQAALDGREEPRAEGVADLVLPGELAARILLPALEEVLQVEVRPVIGRGPEQRPAAVTVVLAVEGDDLIVEAGTDDLAALGDPGDGAVDLRADQPRARLILHADVGVEVVLALIEGLRAGGGVGIAAIAADRRRAHLAAIAAGQRRAAR